MHYLDYAAATPMDPEVLAAMTPYFSKRFYNPSATNNAARQVHADLEAARVSIAYWLGSRPSEVVFTAGGTEANNLAIHGVMRQYPDTNVVVSAVEHESVLAPANHYERRLGPVQPDGRLDVPKLVQLIDENTVLVSVMYANNEVGTVQPIREVAAQLATLRKARLKAGNSLPIYLHTDACQAANYLDLHVARLGVDLLTLNGGKIYGPKQSGILFVKGGLQLAPLIEGGGQERGLRSGTENVAAAIGLAAALDAAQVDRTDELVRMQALQAEFFRELNAKVAGLQINGSLKQRLPNNVHVTIPDTDNERLLIQLDEAGVIAAAGSACSASYDTPSHVLQAMGLTPEAAQSSLRFTMGRQTTSDTVQTAVQRLATILA